MVIDPEIPDETTDPRSTAHRRFARLVESPVSRRLVPRRLVVAVAALMGILGGAAFVGVWLKDRVQGWVAGQPEYQLPFADIRLDPEPPAYIRPGTSGLLEQVRVEAGHPERLGLLKLDTAALVLDFRRSPWVENVTKVDRTYRGLTVHLAYRRPVAVVQFCRGKGSNSIDEAVIDRSGVILPGNDLDRKGFEIRGLPLPLVAIRDVFGRPDMVAGREWKSLDSPELPDLDVLGAARLADFLQSRPVKTPGGREIPRIVSISAYENLDKKWKGYFLSDGEGHWIGWQYTPGKEPFGELTAVEKWTMLMKWVDQSGSLRIDPGTYLKFTPGGVEVARFKPKKEP